MDRRSRWAGLYGVGQKPRGKRGEMGEKKMNDLMKKDVNHMKKKLWTPSEETKKQVKEDREKEKKHAKIFKENYTYIKEMRRSLIVNHVFFAFDKCRLYSHLKTSLDSDDDFKYKIVVHLMEKECDEEIAWFKNIEENGNPSESDIIQKLTAVFARQSLIRPATTWKELTGSIKSNDFMCDPKW